MKKLFKILTRTLVAGIILFGLGHSIYLGLQDNEHVQTIHDILVSESSTDENTVPNAEIPGHTDTSEPESINFSDVTLWDENHPYIVVNNNIPFFTESDKQRTDAFETYSPLDNLGRCGSAFANICVELMPTEKRESIGQVKPSGWHTVKYPEVIEDKYLYNRCHLIGFQLAGENANELNLITGTRYMNVEGMLPFENMIDDYVENTHNHVLYRVSPIFEGSNLVANGVLMEAYSVEDNGNGIQFCVFCYNVQPHISIDYATGNSSVTQ